MPIPRLVISGLSGGSGKTLLSLGLTRAFSRRGLVVQPCKKGPDYIDAAWLSLAASRPAANLDPYFLPPEGLRAQFLHACQRDSPANLALIEGNRGLFDGRDVTGSCSTAQVARTLEAPVILALNCAKMTRTAAAVVAGLTAFEPGLNLAGVVVNNTGTVRHADQIRQALERYTPVPVLGALPRLRSNPLPERHMGLAPGHADPACLSVLDQLADYVEEHLDMDRLKELACSAPPLTPAAPADESTARHGGDDAISVPLLPPVVKTARIAAPAGNTRPDDESSDPEQAGCRRQEIPRLLRTDEKRPLIGYVRDDALWFYYEENLEALRCAGADLAELSLLDAAPWPDLDGLYLGGGFPELFGPQIAASPHLMDIRRISEQNRPIYAECGGFMVLCRALALPDGENHAMAGLLPVGTRFFPRPQGLGYVRAVTTADNPFHPAGSVWRGHEFHYSRCEDAAPDLDFVLRLKPGTGMGRAADGDGRDGLCVRNTFACYTHLFAPAVPHWAPRFVERARATGGEQRMRDRGRCSATQFFS